MKFSFLSVVVLAASPLAAKAFAPPIRARSDGDARLAFALRSSMSTDASTLAGGGKCCASMADIGNLDALLPLSSSSLSLSSSLLSAREARVSGPANAAMLAAAAAAAAASPKPASAAGGAEYGGAATFQSSLRQYFPGSIPNSQVAINVITSLGKRGYKIGETLFGASLCSDEVNWTPQSLALLLRQGLTRKVGGGTFNLGGLGGMPYVGPSGFGAFFSHCPKEGKVVMLFGPHVGISQDGTVGKLERIGMKKLSGACGAAIGAYKALLKQKADGTPIPTGNPIDNQEEYIIAEMSKKLKNETGLDSGTIAAITYRMYEIVWELMNGTMTEVITPGFWDDIVEVTLLGGIVINQGISKGSSDVLVEDYFQPVIFQSWIPKRGNFGFNIVNLYDDAFGEKNSAQEDLEEAAGVKPEMGEKPE